jgi:4-amino-4-deoxy-L-arabinose transferase-like glycosyltransferase
MVNIEKEKISEIKREAVEILPIVIAGCILFYWNLGLSPISVWDEGLYANIAQDMISYDNWVVPYSSYPAGGGTYSPLFEKFPLLYWVEALSFILFGQSEFAARFPSATFGILSAIVVYSFGKELYTRRVGFVSAISFLTIPYMYAGKNAARQGSLETGMLFFGLCFIYCIYRYSKSGDPRWGVGWAIAAGLAVMAKGTAAGIFVLISSPLILLNPKTFIKIRSIKYSIITILTITPWVAIIYNKYPKKIINHVVRVTFERAEHYSCVPGLFESMCYPYLQNIWIQTDPIIYIAMLGFLYSYWSSNRKTIYKNSFMIWWASVVTIFFMFTGNHPWYLIPAYPAFSLITGKVVADAMENVIVARIVVILSTALIFAFSPRIGIVDPFSITLAGTGRTELAKIYQTGVLYVVGLILFSAIIVSSHQINKKILNSKLYFNRYTRLILKTVMALSVLLFFVGVPIVPATEKKTVGDFQDNIKSKELGQRTENVVPKSETVYIASSINNYAWSHFTYEFYSDRKIKPVNISELDKKESIQYAIIRPSRSALDRDYRIEIEAQDTNFRNWLLVNFTER